ncbi:MAG TPA: sodium:solute symporter family protein [Candidatus Acidoferrum sp.]|nr:sodium:solute symporter family protein [Candidatus Acidoferrum sp.]
MQNVPYLISTLITLLAVSWIGIRASKKVKSASDFAVGGRSFGAGKVAAVIVGTLVGGASTIGTAQAAYVKGFGGIWFSIGSSIGCLVLGLYMASPLRQSGVVTIPEFIRTYYGDKARLTSSILSSVAIFVHINGQILSAVAIFTSLFGITQSMATAAAVALIVSYILFGGFLGSSAIGSIKTVLLYGALLLSGGIVLISFGGAGGFTSSFTFNPWFNVFSDGIATSLASGFSVALGVCATQTYLQAVFSAKDVKAAKSGSLLSAILTLPIGVLSAMVGMYMSRNYPDIQPSQALPMFVMEKLGPVIGGVVIATLIISVVATGAGLCLGICTMVSRDIYTGFINKQATDKQELFVLRASVLGVMGLAVLLVLFNLDSLILKWAFLSMALRGTVAFLPLLFILLMGHRVPKKAGGVAMLAAPLITIAVAVTGVTPVDPLYIGLGVGLVIFLFGILFEKNTDSIES